MAVDELVDTLATETSRRTVVKTGVKLAYAAPLVAATFKLTADSVGAQGAVSDPRCTGATCTTFRSCADSNPNCVCFTTTAGGFCGCPRACNAVKACSSNADCPTGEVCAFDTCCPGAEVNSCVIPCTDACTLTTLGENQA